MEIHPNTINKAVREILNELVIELPRYRWESICTYSDGVGKTIIELNVYRNGGSERAGRIAYQLETGEVLNHSYQGMNGSSPTSILDFVLDIANLERRRNAG